MGIIPGGVGALIKAQRSRQVIVVPFSGQLIGQGYNTETGENVGTALLVDSVFEDTSTDAQVASTIFESVESQDSLNESLGMSLSADVRVGLFAGGAKVAYAEQHAVNSSSSYVAGRSVVQNAIRHGKGFRLTPEAQRLIDAGDTAGFKKAFGDRFVRSLNTGGEFCIVARVTSTNAEQQSKVSSALQGEYNGILSAGSFARAFDQATVETNGKTEVSVKMLQSGGQGAQLAFTGPQAASVIVRLQELPTFVHQHASGLEAELATYDTIPIPVKTEEELADRSLVLNDCAAQKTLFLKAISDLQLVLDDNGKLLFDDLPPKDQLVEVLGAYRTALNALMAHAIRVSTGAMNPPQMFVAAPPPPPLTFKKALSKELGDVLVSRGEAIALLDPLAILLRDQPGHSALAFLTGLGAAENQTLPGPGKDRIRDGLALADRASFQQAVDFSLDKNNNLDLAAKGARVLEVNQAAAAARSQLPLSVAWLGFNIAAGLFGKLPEGSGHTAEGPGSNAIRNGLSADGQKGYRAAVKFFLG